MHYLFFPLYNVFPTAHLEKERQDSWGLKEISTVKMTASQFVYFVTTLKILEVCRKI